MAQTMAQTMAGLNLIQQALSIYDRDLFLVVSNRPFREMFDLPKALVTPGAPFADTIRFLASRGEYGPVDDVDELVRQRVQQARAFEPHYMERTRDNGRTIAVEGSPLPQGGWVTVYTDITRPRQQEQLLRARSEELSDQLIEYAEELSASNRQLAASNAALEEAKRQLTDSEARIRLTSEMMPAHIAHVDLDRLYTYSNRQLKTVMPGSSSDVLGHHIRDALGDQAYTAIQPNLDAAFNGKPSIFEFDHELSTRRIRVAFTPDGARRDINGVYILSMDVTEETQTRVALQQTHRREMAAHLTSGLAHDFSNLLTIILGMQSQLSRMTLPEKAGDLIEATLSAARRGGTLLGRIADMTSAREVTLEPTNLDALLTELKTLITPTLSENVSLRITNAVDQRALMLDSGMVQDSLLNLILNARDACGHSGEISVHAKTVKDTWVDLCVADTGTGFSDAALEHALEPFYTTKGGEGSGLGLSMVYNMTKLSGGRVTLANHGNGARVTLRLPLRQNLPPIKPGLVLLVEDSPDLRASVRDMLTQSGHTVIEAASASEARALINELPDITLVLSDITLEGSETGIDLCDQIAQQHPIIMMTSLATDHPLHQQAATRAPVLQKPFSATALNAALTAALQTEVHP
ncbi:MAG: PAS-domain containing protein [Rhodobacterales bacterium]|nr:PAS-domain containing protein [Rhodobacterales bacterium]